MTPNLSYLIRSVEAQLPAESVLRHLIQNDLPAATTLIALCYAHAGEPTNLSADEFRDLAEKVAERVCARWEVRC